MAVRQHAGSIPVQPASYNQVASNPVSPQGSIRVVRAVPVQQANGNFVQMAPMQAAQPRPVAVVPVNTNNQYGRVVAVPVQQVGMRQVGMPQVQQVRAVAPAAPVAVHYQQTQGYQQTGKHIKWYKLRIPKKVPCIVKFISLVTCLILAITINVVWLDNDDVGYFNDPKWQAYLLLAYFYNVLMNPLYFHWFYKKLYQYNEHIKKYVEVEHEKKQFKNVKFLFVWPLFLIIIHTYIHNTYSAAKAQHFAAIGCVETCLNFF